MCMRAILTRVFLSAASFYLASMNFQILCMLANHKLLEDTVVQLQIQ